MSVSILTSQNVLLEYEPASIGDRLLATLIDYAVFMGWILLTVALPAGLKVNFGVYYVILVVLLPILFYDLICEWQFNGQSLGKIAMNIRVVMLDGSQPHLGAYLLRWLLRLVDTRLLSGLVAVIAIAANGKGQRIGDLAAGTTVIKLTQKVSLEQISYNSLPDTYQLQYPEVRLLSDRDIHIVREVLYRGDAASIDRAASKVKEVTGIATSLTSREFLVTILNDYQFLATQDQ